MNDHPHAEPPRGIFDSLRALLDTVLSIFHNRAELFTTEIEEEVTRLVGVFIWAIVAVQAAIIGAAFLAVAIAIAIPSEYRALTAGGLGLLFLVVTVIGVFSIRKILRSKPRPFDATLRELEKDRDHLRGRR